MRYSRVVRIVPLEIILTNKYFQIYLNKSGD